MTMAERKAFNKREKKLSNQQLKLLIAVGIQVPQWRR